MAGIRGLEKRGNGQYGSRETTDQENHIMVAEKPFLVRVMGGKKPVLILDEFGDEPYQVVVTAKAITR
jgi:hypothetical protein